MRWPTSLLRGRRHRETIARRARRFPLRLQELEHRVLLVAPATDFGFNVDRAADAQGRPLLPILVEYCDHPMFTNYKQQPSNTCDPSNRADPAEEQRRAEVRDHYNRLIFGPNYPNVADYFTENSGSLFTWAKARDSRGREGVVGPYRVEDDDETPLPVDESKNATTLLAAGGGTDKGGEIVYANFLAPNGNYLLAKKGGGDVVKASETELDDDVPGTTFKFIDLNGGHLEYGDRVRLKTHTGHFLQANQTLNPVRNVVDAKGVRPSDDRDSPVTFVIAPFDPDLRGQLQHVDKAPKDGKNDVAIRIRLYSVWTGEYLALGGEDGTELTLEDESTPRAVFEVQATYMSVAAQYHQAIRLASEHGHDYSSYARNGQITADELTILMVQTNNAVRDTTTEFAGGAARNFDRFRPPEWTADIAGVGSANPRAGATAVAHGADFQVIAHEVSHTLNTFDLYPKGSNTLTLMGVSPLRTRDDPSTPAVIEGFTHHLDPWHKMRLGWVEPVVYDLRQLAVERPEFRFSDSNGRSILLYDSSRPNWQSEYFLLELRPQTGDYDRDVTILEGDRIPAPGVLVWHVGEDGVYALGNVGNGVADPNQPLSKGDFLEPDKMLWPEGAYRMKWKGAGDQDLDVALTVRHLPGNDWRVELARDTIPPVERLTQEGREGDHNDDLGDNENGDAFGSAVVAADFDGDGLTDLAVGAPGDSPGGGEKSGAVYLYWGADKGPRPFGPVTVLTQAGFGGNENEQGDLFGTVLAVGDFNGDGRPDLAVGAPGENVNGVESGAVYVFIGSSTGLLTAWPAALPAALTQSGLEANEQADLFGAALAVADFDGDGHDDLAVGAQGEEIQGTVFAGAVYVFKGGDTSLTPDEAISLDDPEVNDRFGTALAAADFNDDGKPDLAVGAPLRKFAPTSGESGAVFIYPRVEGTFDPPSVLGQQGSGDPMGNEPGDRFGEALAAGDVSADGIADLVVGAPGEQYPVLDNMNRWVNESFRSGVAFVYQGSHTAANLAALTPYPSMLTQAPFSPRSIGDNFGAAVLVGDFSGDGVADVAVGAPGEMPGWTTALRAGAVTLFRSACGALVPDRYLPQLGGEEVSQLDEGFGKALAIGNFNGQGGLDLAVGAPKDISGDKSAGSVFHFSALRNRLPLEEVPGTPNDDAWYVSSDATGRFIEIHKDNKEGPLLYCGPRNLFGAFGGTLTFQGGEGNDRLIVDAAEYFPLLGALRFEGGEGTADKLEIRGSESADIFTARNGAIDSNGSSTFYAGVEQLSVSGLDGGDSFAVRHTAVGTSLEIFGGDGADSISVGAGDFLNNIRGAVHVHGGASAGGAQPRDTLTIDDHLSVAGLASDGYTIAGLGDSDVFFKTRTQGSPPLSAFSTFLTFAETENVILEGSNDPNQFDVFSTVSGMQVTLNGNGGLDHFIVGDGDYDSRIRGGVTINGGAEGNDVLVIDDQDDLDDDRYILTDDDFTKESQRSGVPTLEFTGIGEITIEGSNASSTFDIRDVDAGVTVTVNGHDGQDTFNVGRRDFDTNISGTVIANGGDGDDILNIDDQGDLTEDDYTITANAFTKSTTAGNVRYGSIRTFNFDANSRNNTINVSGVSSQMTLNVRAHDGIDEILIGEVGAPLDFLGGQIDIDGGPGDDVLKATTPRSFDQMVVEATPDNRGFIHGTSGHPLLTLPFVSLTYSDVRHVTLDVASNDLTSFSFPPGPSSVLYPPVPVDTVSLLAGALGVAGLDRFEVRTGIGPNFVNDAMLTGASPASAVLAIHGAGGATVHQVYGMADRIELAQRVTADYDLTALDAEGQVLHRVEGELVTNLLVPDPQADVEVTMSGSSATVTAGGSGRQRLTAGTTTEILPAGNGRLRLRTAGDLTVNFVDVLFPQFQFDPLFGLPISPIGVFYVRPVRATSETSPGSLRNAIARANTAPAGGRAVVFFDLPETDPGYVDVDSHLSGGDVAPDVFRIQPLAALPALTRGDTLLNGASQQAVTGDSNPFGPEIVLDGSRAGAGINGVELRSPFNIVHGLNIQRFGHDGILIAENGNGVTGSYIGTDATGAQAQGNATGGIEIVSGANNNTLGGTATGARNVISGNQSSGVFLGDDAHHNLIAGNYIGLNAAGDAALGNVESGIVLYRAGTGNVIGGVSANARNVISGNRSGSNTGSGIVNADTTGTIITGNYVGVDVTGSRALGNEVYGIFFGGGQAGQIGTNGDGFNDALEGNVISGNGFAGIHVGGSGNNTENLVIAGNRIGTNAAGTATLPSHNYAGIVFSTLLPIAIRFNRVGTNGDGISDELERNLIAGSNGDGVQFLYFPGATISDNAVAGNSIGTDVTGTFDLGNRGSGIFFGNGAHGNRVGTDGNGIGDAAEGNTIAFNRQAGVVVSGAASLGNRIRRNSIHSNGGIGIDLAADGITPNDLDQDGAPVEHDRDLGPNRLQNFPDLATARVATDYRVTGRIKSTANTTLIIDFYASPAAELAGFRQGARWIGSTTVTTNRDGESGITATVAAIAVGELITATATDPAGNTSEFSGAVAVRGGGGGGRGGSGQVLMATALPDNRVAADLLSLGDGEANRLEQLGGKDILIGSTATLDRNFIARESRQAGWTLNGVYDLSRTDDRSLLKLTTRPNAVAVDELMGGDSDWFWTFGDLFPSGLEHSGGRSARDMFDAFDL